jgi:lysophospholipase L1-like esterase
MFFRVVSGPRRTYMCLLTLAACTAVLALVASRSAPAAPQLVGGHLLQALGNDASDLNIVVAGDSTGDEPDEWVFLLAQQLGTLYPGYGVNYYLWNRRNPGWPATPWLIQEGAPGTHVLNIWNMSVSGTRENYGLTYAESVIVPKQPDLLLVSYGHNDGEDTVRFRWGVQSLVETVAAGSPRTEILLVAQNPETGNTFQQAHAAELAQLASEEHLGLVDILGAFEATGNSSAYVKDGIHPTLGGSYLWMNTVLAALRSAADAPDGPRQNSGARPVSLIRFGDFSRFVHGKPDAWILNNAKPTVDFQDAEAPHRFAVKLTAVNTTSASIYQPFPIEQVRGRWVTVAVRLFLPSQARSTTVGMVGVPDSRTDVSMTTQRGDGPRGRYFWDIVSRRIDPRAKAAGVIIYVDASPTQPSGSTILVQQVLAVLGTRAPLDQTSAGDSSLKPTESTPRRREE